METWVAGVKRLDVFSIIPIQTAYVSLKMSLQKDWQFFQSITPRFGSLFVPLEVTLRNNFILTLLGGIRDEVTDLLCKWITWGVKRAGIVIPDHIQTETNNFEISENCCKVLNNSLLNEKALDTRKHATQVREGCNTGRERRFDREEGDMEVLQETLYRRSIWKL